MIMDVSEDILTSSEFIGKTTQYHQFREACNNDVTFTGNDKD
jgi:hypothetical protein